MTKKQSILDQNKLVDAENEWRKDVINKPTLYPLILVNCSFADCMTAHSSRHP